MYGLVSLREEAWRHFFIAMKTVLLQRCLSDSKQTLGTLTTVFGEELFVCKVLELPWKWNQSNVSCVPAGPYECTWTRSNRLSTAAGHDVFTYELQNVPQRAGIRIHSANFYYSLLGCLALGDAHKDINADGELDVIHSGATVKKFNELMRGELFVLNIRTV